MSAMDCFSKVFSEISDFEVMVPPPFGVKSQRARLMHSELGYLRVFQGVGVMSVGLFSLIVDTVSLLWRWRTLEKTGIVYQ